MRARVVVLLLILLPLVGCFGIDPNYRPVHPPKPVSTYADTLPAALLWAHPYPNLLVEIDYVEGREPSTLALDAFSSTLREVTDKQEIVVSPPTLLPMDDPRFSEPHEWTVDELREIHGAYFDSRAHAGYGADQSARLHVLYLNGFYGRNTTQGGLFVVHALGVQVGDCLFVFKDELDNPYGYQIERHRVWHGYYERATLVHELGHALGLVDNGIPMQRPHVAEDGVHSNNPESVMAVNNDDTFVQEMAQDNEWIPYKFDADDLADLAAFRELGRSLGPE